MKALNLKSLSLFSIPMALVLAGCGDIRLGDEGHTAPTESYSAHASSASSISTITSTIDPNYNCPEEANVKPDYDRDIGRSAWFRVCTNKTSTYNIMIIGKPSYFDENRQQVVLSNSLCIFPVQEYSESERWLKPDQNMQPMSICADTTTLDLTRLAYVLIDKTNFNAGYIVAKEVKDKMKACLISKDYFDCPSYSYGKFR